MSAGGWPIALRMVDIRERLRPLTALERYPKVRVFVSDGPDLIGSVDISNARRAVSAVWLRDAIVNVLGDRLARRAVALGLERGVIETPPLAKSVSVSVIVPTCDRPDDLRRCLLSLTTQDVRRELEIIVVDNRPRYRGTRSVTGDFPGVKLVEERRPGLSYARNAGFAAASGDVLVATDDDVVAPPDWIEKLVAPFGRREVVAVTGHVLPLELETEAQCRFEAYGGLGKGFDPFEADGNWFRSMRAAVPTWRLGATANAAFRAAALADPRVGVMHEALGAGMPTGCSEDTYLFYKILKAGYTITYVPSAYVWHRHRRTDPALRNQIYAYSKGHVAYHLLTLTSDRDARALIRLAWSLPKTYLRRAFERLRRRSDYPLSLIALEIAGNLAGPFALWRARRRVRLIGAGARLTRQHSSGAGPPGAGPASTGGSPQPSEPDHAVPVEGPFAQNSSR